MRAVLIAAVLLTTAAGSVLAQEKDKDAPRPAGKIATEEEVAAHLKVADTKVGPARINAVRWFSTVHPPNEKVKGEVARKLVEYIEDPKTDGITIGRCGEALPNWATEEIAPKLITYMLRGERKGAMIALGRLKYDKAIPE